MLSRDRSDGAAAGLRPDAGATRRGARALADGRRRRRWLDAYGGHAVATTGHSHPRVVRGHRRAGRSGSSSTPRRCRIRIASSSPARARRARAPIRSAGSSSATRARRPTRTRCSWRGSDRPRAVASVTGGWHGRTVATLACYRRGAVRGRRPPRRHAALRAGRVQRHRSLDARAGRLGRGAASSSRCRGWPARATAASSSSRPPARICTERGHRAPLRRGPVRRRPHRRLHGRGVYRRRARRDHDGQGTRFRAIRSARSWPAPCWPRASGSATSAAPSAAGRWPAPRRSPRSTSSSDEDLVANAARVGAHIAARRARARRPQGAGARAPAGPRLRPAGGGGAAGALRPAHPHRHLVGSGRAPAPAAAHAFRSTRPTCCSPGCARCSDDQARLPGGGGLVASPRCRRCSRSLRGSSGARSSGGLERKVLAMVFLDPSLRTRASFETAMFLHGGHAIVLEPGKGSWALETEDGVVMDGTRSSTSSRRRGCWAGTPTRWRAHLSPGRRLGHRARGRRCSGSSPGTARSRSSTSSRRAGTPARSWPTR